MARGRVRRLAPLSGARHAIVRMPFIHRRHAAVAAVALSLAYAVGILAGLDALNGTWYWRRPWIDLGVLRCALLLALPLPLVRVGLSPRFRSRTRLVALVLASFGFQLAAAACHPDAWERVRAIVESPVATSYFTDATRIADLREWLAGFHAARLELHSATHPPGPILFHHAVLRIAGPESAPLAAALLIGLIAASGVAVMWRFAGIWTDDPEARLAVAAWYAMLPALVVFFPEFDQCYPILTMLLVTGWIGALRGSLARAAAFGVVAFVATMFAWNLLSLGVFFALAVAWWWRHARGTPKVPAGLSGMLVALATFVACHALFALVSGYRPFASLFHAIDTQAVLAAMVDRPWWACVLLDPWDFLVGSGVASIPLLVLFLARMPDDARLDAATAALIRIGLATILVIDVSGLLRAETARVWLFLQPFVVVPAGLALARIEARWRIAVFAAQWLVLVAMVTRLSFIDP